MNFESKEYNSQLEILKRKLGGELFEPITLASGAFTDGVCKAGNPIKADGTVDNTASSAAIGILLTDVHKENPNGTVVRAFACVNEKNCNENAGITLDASAKKALPLIVFE